VVNNERARKKDSARLVWDSKPRRAPNPKDIEFQTAEVVIPNWVRDGGQIPMSFRDGMFGEQELDKQRLNRLVWGDNLLAMQALLTQGYESKIKLVYIDPPFWSQEQYNFQTTMQVGDTVGMAREPSFIERLAYKDTWIGGIDSYLDMLYPRLQLMKRLLAEDGSIYVHLDWHAGHYVKTVMDEIFGKDNFRNEIHCKRVRKNVQEYETTRRLNVALDTLMFYAKSDSHRVTLPRSEQSMEERWHAFDAPDLRTGMDYELFGVKPPPGRHWMWGKQKAEEAIKQGILRENQGTGRPEYRVITENPIIGTLWDDIPAYSFRYGFATEKSEKLLLRILQASTKEGDLVSDFFCGSGTTLAVAEKLGRQWIGCDLSKVAIQVTRTRLVQQDARPFLIENIGNYQREMIYLSGGRIGEMQQVILKLYGATPRRDSADLGTRHNPEDGVLELVYVGYPDRPVTARKAEELARQAEKLDGTGYKRLVILAWDYDYNYSSELENRLKAAKQPIKTKIESRTIPPDIYDYLKKAKDEEDIEPLRGKIKFYEKPYLRQTKPQIKPGGEGKAEVTIGIERYVVFDLPVAEKEREKLQALMKDNFAVLIDYWAVDWDYDGYSFKSQWQDMRGNGRKTKVVTTQATTNLATGKTYTIAVRLVDIFGNDAAGTVEVKL